MLGTKKAKKMRKIAITIFALACTIAGIDVARAGNVEIPNILNDSGSYTVNSVENDGYTGYYWSDSYITNAGAAHLTIDGVDFGENYRQYNQSNGSGSFSLINDSNIYLTSDSNFYGGSLNIENGSTLGFFGSLFNANTTNNGSLSMITGTIANSITGSGNLRVTGTTVTNSSGNTIEQNLVTVALNANFTNDGSIVGSLANNGTISGTGSIELKGNSENISTARINQTSITVDNGAVFTNSGTTNAALTNNGIITGESGSGHLTLTGDSTNNTGKSITQASVTVDTDKKLTNNGNVTSAIVNRGTIDGTGSLYLNGTSTNNAGKSITQDSITVYNGANLNNLGTVKTVLTNQGAISGKGSIELTGDSLNDTGATIEQGTITIDSGKKLTNIGSLTAGTVDGSGTLQLGEIGNYGSSASITNDISNSIIVLGNKDNNLYVTSGAIKGNLSIGDGANAGYLNFKKGTIHKDATLDLTSSGTLKLNGGASNNVEVTFDSADTWAGAVAQSGIGVINLSGIGEDFKTGSLQSNSGTLNIKDGSAFALVSGDDVKSATNVNIASGTSLKTNGGSLYLSATGDDADSWMGSLINAGNGSTLTVDGFTGDNAKAGSFTQTSGTTTFKNGFDMNNSSDSISDGSVVSESDFNVSAGSVYKEAGLDITGDMNVSGGNVEYGGASDSVSGKIAQTGGTLNIVDTTSTKMNVSAGNLNVKNDGTTLNLVDGSTVGASAVVNVAENTTVDVQSGSTLEMTGGSDTWNGAIKNSGSSNVVIDGFTGGSAKGSTATFTQTSGTTTFKNGFDMNNASDSISGGSVVSNGNFNVSNGNVAKEANLTITGDMNISGNGVVNYGGASDSVSGKIAQTGGTLNIVDSTSTTLDVTGGTLSLENGTLTVGAGSIIESGAGKATVNIANGTIMNITAGTVTLDGDSNLSKVSWAGDVTLNGGTLSLKNIVDSSRDASNNKTGKLTASTGNLTIDSSTVLLGAKDTIADAVKLTLNNADLKIGKDGSETASVYVGTDDSFSGKITLLNSGSLTLDGITTNDTSSIDAQSGKLNLVNTGTGAHGSATGITLGNANDSIAYAVNTTLNSDLTINKGKVQLDSGDQLTKGKMTVSGGELDLKAISTGSNVSLNAQSGTLKIQTGGTFLNNANDVIAKAVATSIESDAILDINKSGASVTLDGTNDTWAGEIDLTNGNLTLTDALVHDSANGIYKQTGGTLNVDNAKLSLTTTDSTITGGNVNLKNAGNLELKNGKEHSAIVKTDTTKNALTLASNSTLNLKDNSVVNYETKVDVASGSTLNAEGSNTVLNLSKTIDSADTWAGAIENKGATINLTNMTKDTGATYKQATAGSILNVYGNDTSNVFDLNNASDSISAGTLNLGDGSNEALMNVSAGTIASGVVANLKDNSKLTVNGGSATLNGSEDGLVADTWAGEIDLTSGTLTLEKGLTHQTSDGIYKQTGGTLNIQHAMLSLEADGSAITGGNVNLSLASNLILGNETENSAIVKTADASISSLVIAPDTTLNLKDGSNINYEASVKVEDGSTLNAEGSTTVLNLSKKNPTTSSADTWNGAIENKGAIINLSNMTKGSNATYKQATAGSTTNVYGNDTSNVFDLNNTSDLISAGILNLGDGSNVALMNVSKGTISKDAVANLKDNSKLTVNGGNVTLNGTGASADTWAGEIDLTSGNLTLTDALVHDSADGIYKQTGGTLNIDNGSKLSLTTDDSVISGGTVNLSKASTVEFKNGEEHSAIVKTDTTKNALTLASNSTLNLKDNSVVNYETKVDVASGSTLNAEGSTTVLNLSKTIDSADTWAGAIENKGATINLTNMTKESSALYTQETAGSILNVLGTDTTNAFDLNNTSDLISYGALNIGDGANKTLMNVSAGTIASGADVNLKAKSELDIIGENADVTLNGVGSTGMLTADTWAGDIKMTNGNLTLNNLLTHDSADGKYNQEGGTLNVDNAKLSLTTDDSTITGGVVNLKNAGKIEFKNGVENSAKVTTDESADELTLDNNSVLNLNNESKVTYKAIADIENGSTLNVIGADTVLNLSKTIDNADAWNGAIENKGATINLTNMTKDADATYKQATAGSILNVLGTDQAYTFDMNNTSDLISAGTLNIGNGSDKDLMNVSAGTIEKGATVNSKANSLLTINGADGNVTLNGTGADADTWAGDIQLTDGNLNLIDSLTHDSANGKYNQEGGTLNMDTALLALTTNDSKIDGGKINLANNSVLAIMNGYDGNEAQVVTKDDTTNILLVGDAINTSGFELIDESVINEPAIITVNPESELIISDNSKVVLNENDNWAPHAAIDLTGGDLVYKNRTDSVTNDVSDTTKPLYQQTGGSLYMENSTMNLANAPAISGGDIAIDKNSTLNVAKGGFTVDDLISTGMINSMNKATDNKYVVNGDMGILNADAVDPFNNAFAQDGQADFTFDFYARTGGNKDSDKFTISGGVISADPSKPAVVYIPDWDLLGNLGGADAPIDRAFDFKVFDASSYDPNVIFAATDKQILTPIGWYGLHSKGNGVFRVQLDRYNPTVFRGQVEKVAQYANQLTIDNILFDHVDLINQRDMIAEGQMDNKYASVQEALAPYQYDKKKGGVWFKSYGNFENIGMGQGFDVRNYGYGALVGVDLDQIELSNGWKLTPTFYAAYNGAHQTYNGIGLYENGGQLGAMGTFTKGNFIGSILGYGGGYATQMNGFNNDKDNVGNWFAGAATKLAYNFKLPLDLYLQPTVFAAYNAFGEENWETSYGMMSMNSGMLNGINIAPGLNLIWNKKTFSIYATTQLMFNILGGVDGQAGNVTLPTLQMGRTYFEYGLGFRKTFKERFSCYLQATARAGARLGGAVQGGFEFRF